jgi:hypothetical protein
VQPVVLLGDLHQPVGVRERQGPQQDGIHHAEDRRGRPDPDGDGETTVRVKSRERRSRRMA